MDHTIFRTLALAGLTAMGLTLFGMQPQDQFDARSPKAATSMSALDGTDRLDLAIAIQIQLALLGFDPGDIDGVIGSKSRAAIRAYRDWAGEPNDNRSGEELLLALRRRP